MKTNTHIGISDNCYNYCINIIEGYYSDYKPLQTCGIWNGNAGRAIDYFLFSRFFQSETYNKKANIALDYINDNIVNVSDLDFENGVAGIGWAIEWICQNKFIEANTDEILEDVDDNLYKSVLYSLDENISLKNGVLGKLKYFYSRFKSTNLGTNRFRSICHEECLVILTDDLHGRIVEKKLGQNNRNIEDVIDIGLIAVFFSHFLQCRINVVTVEEVFYKMIGIIESHLDDVLNRYYLSGNITYKNKVLYLAVCYYIAARIYKMDVWQFNAIKIVDSIINNKSSNDGYSCMNVVSKIIIYAISIICKDERLRSVIDIQRINSADFNMTSTKSNQYMNVLFYAILGIYDSNIVGDIEDLLLMRWYC